MISRSAPVAFEAVAFGLCFFDLMREDCALLAVDDSDFAFVGPLKKELRLSCCCPSFRSFACFFFVGEVTVFLSFGAMMDDCCSSRMMPYVWGRADARPWNYDS
jgi:hypothetical protein